MADPRPTPAWPLHVWLLQLVPAAALLLLGAWWTRVYSLDWRVLAMALAGAAWGTVTLVTYLRARPGSSRDAGNGASLRPRASSHWRRATSS